VREFEIVDKDQQRRVVVFYNSDVSPVVLRRRSVVRTQDGAKQTVETEQEVLALSTPRQVLKQMLPASLVRTVQKTDSASITTTAVVVPDVPGGVVSSTSQEQDAQGKLVRRTTLELVDWGAKAEPNDSPNLTRREMKRQRRRNK
jgi:hypothetical protein